MSSTATGLIAGLLLGLAYIAEGLDALLIVGLFGVIGVVVGRVLQGELDLTEYIGGRNRR